MGMNVGADQLTGWIPIRLYWNASTPVIDWCWVGTRRFTDLFFGHTIDACLRLPFSSLFRPQTPIDALRERHAMEPGLQPRGFIFHMSRCGSTLVSQMLASLPGSVVALGSWPHRFGAARALSSSFSNRGESSALVEMDD